LKAASGTARTWIVLAEALGELLGPVDDAIAALDVGL
jgi:hypothetical protein